MRIALDGRYFANPTTGINMVVRALLRLLLDRGFDVTLVVNEQPPADIEGLGKCTVVVLPRNRYKIDLLWEQVSLPIWLYRNSFDYYIAPGNKGIPLLYFGKTKRLLIVHDLIPFHFMGMYFKQQPLIMALYFPAIIISILRASKILTVSQTTGRDIKRLFGRRSTPFMLPLRYMRLLDAVIPPVATRKPQVVYNGGTDPRKNFPLLLEGFARLHRTRPDYKLVVLGKGYERFVPHMTALGIQDAVELRGYVTQADKLRIIAESAAIAYPSLMEGYGLPIVEAMMARTPIICGVGGSQREVAGKAGILLETITVDTIAAALLRVAEGRIDPRYDTLAAEQLAYLADPIHEQTIIDQLQ